MLAGQTSPVASDRPWMIVDDLNAALPSVTETLEKNARRGFDMVACAAEIGEVGDRADRDDLRAAVL